MNCIVIDDQRIELSQETIDNIKKSIEIKKLF
jgi:hypothetical protein